MLILLLLLLKYSISDFDDMDVMECVCSHESAVTASGDSQGPTTTSSTANGGHIVNLENGRVTLSEAHFSELQKNMHAFRAKVCVFRLLILLLLQPYR